MNRTRVSDGGKKNGLDESSNAFQRVQVGEAQAQVNSQEAEGIKEQLAGKTTISDVELLIKLVEARYAKEGRRGYTVGYTGAMELEYERNLQRSQAIRELLRKAALDGPLRPPKHARFAVFLLPHSYQHIIFGDLEEQYPQWVEECGESKARFLYWWQFLLSTAIIMWPRIRRWRYAAIVLVILARLLRAWHLG